MRERSEGPYPSKEREQQADDMGKNGQGRSPAKPNQGGAPVRNARKETDKRSEAQTEEQA